jgi:hypothetical protein
MNVLDRPHILLEGRGDRMVVRCARCARCRAIISGPGLDGSTRRWIRYHADVARVLDTHHCEILEAGVP